MKRVAIILLILMMNIISFFSYYDYNKLKIFPIANNIKKYAQIQKDNVNFYFSKNENDIAFEIPRTYYVELLAKEDELGFHNAKYLNQIGYVKKQDIIYVSNQPSIPFLANVNFRILATQSAELRNEPSREKGLNSLICELNLYETNFIYYGTRKGEEVVSKRGDIWYYCSYFKNGIENFGYIYSGLIDQLSQITIQELNTNIIDNHNWEINSNTNQVQPNFQLDTPSSSQLAIILVISIPALILLISLFKPIKIKKGIKNKVSIPKSLNKDSVQNKSKLISFSQNKEKPKAEKGKDFYELK